MLLFKRILRDSHRAIPSDRRGPPRFLVYPQFPVTAVLRFANAQLPETSDGTPKTSSRDWTAKLLNLSISGVRLQLPLEFEAKRHDQGQVIFDVQGYLLTLAGHISFLESKEEAKEAGVAIDTPDLETLRTFEQLVFMAAFGSSLLLADAPKADESGYFFECYNGVRHSHLKVWRTLDTKEVVAFEFAMLDCMVRGQTGRPGVQCLRGIDTAKAEVATPEESAEITRLYDWVVRNLSPSLPVDVREFLLEHAG